MVFQWENIFGGQDRELETRLLTSSRTVAEDTVLLTASIQPNLVPPMAVRSSPLNLWRLPWMGPSSDVGVSGTWQSTPRSLCKPTLAFSTVKHRVRLHLSVSSWAALQRCFTQESLFSLGSSIRASPLAIAAFNLSAPWVAPWGEAHIEKVMLCKCKGFVNLGNFSWGPLYHMRKNNRVIFKYRNESIKIAKKSLAWAPAPNSSLLPSLLPSHHAWAFPCAYQECFPCVPYTARISPKPYFTATWKGLHRLSLFSPQFHRGGRSAWAAPAERWRCGDEQGLLQVGLGHGGEQTSLGWEWRGAVEALCCPAGQGRVGTGVLVPSWCIFTGHHQSFSALCNRKYSSKFLFSLQFLLPWLSDCTNHTFFLELLTHHGEIKCSTTAWNLFQDMDWERVTAGDGMAHQPLPSPFSCSLQEPAGLSLGGWRASPGYISTQQNSPGERAGSQPCPTSQG